MVRKLLVGLALLSSFSAFATETIKAGQSKDFNGASIGTSCKGQSETQQPVLILEEGASVSNVTIKAGGGADGIHCLGNCNLTNVVWADVCEDAATMKGGAGTVMTVTGGSATGASDKIFQHNGIGSTVKINDFTVIGSNGKLYRACGNCSKQGIRKVEINNLTVNGKLNSGIAGVNSNYGDTAKIRNVKWKGYKEGSSKVCVPYIGYEKSQKKSSTKDTKTPKWDSATCDVSKSDVKAF